MTKEYIDGMPLREYIIKSLCHKSYRELVVDGMFIEKTGISVLGTLTYYARKHKITLTEIYSYGKDNLLIMPGVSFQQWLINTGRSSIVQKIKKDELIEIERLKKRRELLNQLGSRYGLVFSDDKSISFIITCLCDFYNREYIQEYIESNCG